MNVTPEAIKAITDRTLREVARKAIFARSAGQPFNLITEGHNARNRIQLAIALVMLDKVTPAGVDRFNVASSDPKATPYEVIAGSACERLQCDQGVHCSCPDHRHRGVRCKHSLAVGLFLRSNGGDR